MTGFVAIEERPPLSGSERAMARRLGLGLAIVVAIGCDLIVMAVRGEGDEWQGDWSVMAIGLVVGLLPIFAAAPFGWLLGPTLARARLPGKIGVAVVMSILTMLLGDVVYVLGAASLSSILTGESSAAANLPGLLMFIVLGAVIVGPFVIALATLPAAVVWVCAFRLVWRSIGETATS